MCVLLASSQIPNQGLNILILILNMATSCYQALLTTAPPNFQGSRILAWVGLKRRNAAASQGSQWFSSTHPPPLCLPPPSIPPYLMHPRSRVGWGCRLKIQSPAFDNIRTLKPGMEASLWWPGSRWGVCHVARRLAPLSPSQSACQDSR